MASPPDAGPAESLAERAAQLRADATTHLSGLTPGTSLCAIGRSGTGYPALKYWEGQAAAAGDVMRQSRRHPHEPAAAIAEVRRKWDDQRVIAEGRGPDWDAYLAGAGDALEELVAATHQG